MHSNRRAFIGSLVLAAGGAGIVGIGSRERLVSGAVRAFGGKAPVGTGALGSMADAAVLAHSPLPAAATLALELDGARVVGVHPVHCGALPVIVENAGTRFQIDVLRRDAEGMGGVVDTEHLSLFVRNGGAGNDHTGRPRELAARALGRALSAHGETFAASLLTFRERSERHPGAIYDVDHGDALAKIRAETHPARRDPSKPGVPRIAGRFARR
jgi:hypothetical protein